MRYRYRRYLPDTTEDEIEVLKEKLYDGTATEDDINMVTEPLGSLVEAVCGWEPSYAQTIAEWLVKVGTENTTSCNMIIGFEKVNERYGVNLYEDEFLCDEIVEQLYRHEAILDVVTDENTFDMNFGYLYCPYAEEHEELTM